MDPTKSFGMISVGSALQHSMRVTMVVSVDLEVQCK